jgi:S-DNA-T family DNA segregation ATPase FtsK/SpoIIIE
MADQPRNRRHDLWGLALAAVTVFLTLAVLTTDPADPVEAPVWPLELLYQPDLAVYPVADSISNACGYWGALFSRASMAGIGVGTFLVIGLMGLTSYKILTRGGFKAPFVRSLGWTLVGLATVTAATLSHASSAVFPVYGAGGAIGAMAAAWLDDHFAAAGAWILTLTLLGFGLLLSTDYLLIHLGHVVVVGGTKASVGGLKRAKQAANRSLPRRRVTDLDGGVKLASHPDLESEAGHPAIRIRGKSIDDGPPMVVPALPSDKPKEDDHDTRETESEKTTAPAGLASRLTSALGLGSASRTEESVEEADSEVQAEVTKTRELEIDGETTILRQDDEHTTGELKIRTPAKRKDERQQLYDALQEELPDGADDYVLPPVDLLIQSDDVCYDKQAEEVRRKALILEQTFKNFGFNIRVVEIETGPVIAQYEVELEAGLRLSKITGLAEDLAIALRVPSVRIVAPIPGKNTVGIEVPNETRQVVRLRDVIEECGTAARKMKIPIFLGKDVSGNSLTVDLASMPHLLIAGRTGTGKSVCLNAIISSILMTRRPDEVRMLMIDPKMVELSGYGRLPHLMHPVVTDMKKAEAILGWAVDKMEERYSLLAQVGVRHIASYNELGREELIKRLGIEDPDQAAGIADHLPFIVIVADEMADLMMTAGKEVEQHIIRLAQKSRAVGIHLILATQKPTVDVITGLIKSNLPARISFQVASRTDSRVVLDENGADKLLGNGDMLFLWPGTSTLLRGQGTYLSDDEIDRVCGHCGRGEQNFVGELMNLKVAEEENPDETGGPKKLKNRDELYESAVDVVVREGRGSCSLLQRALGIGYGRAARLIDFMAEDGIVGQYNGSQAREVLISIVEWEGMQGIESEDEPETEPAAATPPPRTRTIRRGDGWVDPADDDDAHWEQDETPAAHHSDD